MLDAGRLKEFDAPYVLLKNPRGIFCQLVEQTGPVEARRLYEIARDKYNQQQVAILETDVINDNESQEEKKPEVSVSLPPADDSQSMPLPQSHDESQKPKLLPAGEVEKEPDSKHSQLSSLVHVKI